jgi:CRISPR-associated protein Cas2
MKGYGDHLQLSVFRCDLCKSDRIKLESALADLIDHKQDQVLFVNVGLSDGRARRAFATVGRPYIDPERHAVIV